MTTPNSGSVLATQKPVVAQKSALVLALAREIITQKRRRNRRSYSDSDIYDDILTLSELHNETEDDIYDDVIPNVSFMQNGSNGTTHFGITLPPDDDVYDDVISIRKDATKLNDSTIQQEFSPSVRDCHVPSVQSQPTGVITSRKEQTQSSCDQDYSVSGKPQAGKISHPHTTISHHGTSTVTPPIHISSFEDIYDDIIVYRSQTRGQQKRPNVPPKLKSLYQHPRVKELLSQQRQKKASEIEEIYDTMTNEELAFMQNMIDQNAGSRNEDPLQEEYIDPATIQGSSGSDEESYVNTTKEGDQIREQGKKVDYTKFGLKLLPTKKRTEKDSPTETSQHEPSGDVHHKVQFSQLKTKSATLPSRYQTQLHPDTSANRQSHDPLPDINSRLKQYSFIEEQPMEYTTSDEEGYEDLALYEDVEQYQDKQQEDYEDLDLTVASALGLPEKIRGRSTRIVKGRMSRKLRKSVNRRIMQRNAPNSSVSNSSSAACSPGVTRKESEQTNLASKSMPELTPSNSSEPNVCFCVEQIAVDDNTENEDSQLGLEEKQTITESKTESSDDNDGEDEVSIPFGKSREVFELLLDASNIVRVTESSATPGTTQTKDSKLDFNAEKESSSKQLDSNVTKRDQSYLDSVEFQRLSEVARRDLKPYQEAGVIYVRPKSEIEADIEEIVKNAPLVPPPLPGIQRPRARVITRSDRVLRKRVILRRHTMHSMPLDKNTT